MIFAEEVRAVHTPIFILMLFTEPGGGSEQVIFILKTPEICLSDIYFENDICLSSEIFRSFDKAIFILKMIFSEEARSFEVMVFLLKIIFNEETLLFTFMIIFSLDANGNDVAIFN